MKCCMCEKEAQYRMASCDNPEDHTQCTSHLLWCTEHVPRDCKHCNENINNLHWMPCIEISNIEKEDCFRNLRKAILDYVAYMRSGEGNSDRTTKYKQDIFEAAEIYGKEIWDEYMVNLKEKYDVR